MSTPVVKTKNLFMEFPWTEVQQASAGVLPSYNTHGNVKVTFTRTRTGEPLPNWKTTIRAGGNATTTFTASESTTESQGSRGGSLTYLAYNALDNSDGRASMITANCTGLSNYYPPVNIVTHTGNTSSEWEANNQAVTFLYRQIRKAHAQAEGGVILGELHKTLSMIASPAMALRKGILDYTAHVKRLAKGQVSNRHGRLYPTPKLKEIITQTYLEYTYGWSPLINDVKDAAIALARINYP